MGATDSDLRLERYTREKENANLLKRGERDNYERGETERRGTNRKRGGGTDRLDRIHGDIRLVVGGRHGPL